MDNSTKDINHSLSIQAETLGELAKTEASWYAMRVFMNKVALCRDLFNLFNNDSVTEYNEAGDISANSVTLSPDFLNDVNYQAPRSVRFSARYDF